MKKGLGKKVNGFLQYFTVEGEGDFPFDMLRYDNAWPELESEIHKLVPAPTEKYGQPRRIKLLRFTFNGEGPNEARWKSFLWKIAGEVEGRY